MNTFLLALYKLLKVLFLCFSFVIGCVHSQERERVKESEKNEKVPLGDMAISLSPFFWGEDYGHTHKCAQCIFQTAVSGT